MKPLVLLIVDNGFRANREKALVQKLTAERDGKDKYHLPGAGLYVHCGSGRTRPPR